MSIFQLNALVKGELLGMLTIFYFVIAPIFYMSIVGSLGLLLMERTAKARHYSPALISLSRFMIVGISLFIVINIILFKYSPNIWLTYICLGIEAIVLFIIIFRFVLHIKQERQIAREQRQTHRE